MKKTFPKVCLHCEQKFNAPASHRYCSTTCNVAFRLKALKLPPNKCWIWPGAKESAGYGHIRYYGEIYKAHRLSYEAHKGKIPKGQLIRHTCDTPSCCNPNHLLLGTVKDNMRDAIERGSFVFPITIYGEAHHEARFSKKDIPTVRKRFEQGDSMRSIARDYGVSHEAVRKIVRLETWVHVK